MDPSHAEALRKGLERLWRSDKLCDLTIRAFAEGSDDKADAVEVSVHSAVVAALSEPLEQMIDGPMACVEDGVLTLQPGSGVGAALLGTVMDMAPLILILTPILLPVITGIGVDPVHFGMIMLVNLGIGLITPPVGAVLFVGSAVGKVSIESTVKALLPFYLALFLVLMAVTYIPAISLWLPSVVL